MNLHSNINRCFYRLVIAALISLSAAPSILRANDVEQIRLASAARHTEMAMTYQQSGNLQRALREWRIVDALTSGLYARQQIAELELVIKARSASLLIEAQEALRAGEERRAKRVSLAVLALDPDNTGARNNVRLIESGQRLVELAVKNEKKLAKTKRRQPKVATSVEVKSLPIARQQTTAGKPPSNSADAAKTTATASTTEPSEPVRDADNSLSNQTKNQTKNQTMTDPAQAELAHRQTLAERHFRQGLELFLSDRSAAIAEFNRSLVLNPDHTLARRYRSTALKLQ